MIYDLGERGRGSAGVWGADFAGRGLAGGIRECASAGFPTGVIIAGIELVHLIPHGDAKKLVTNCLFSEQERAELDEVHSMLEEALCDPNDWKQ